MFKFGNKMTFAKRLVNILVYDFFGKLITVPPERQDI